MPASGLGVPRRISPNQIAVLGSSILGASWMMSFWFVEDLWGAIALPAHVETARTVYFIAACAAIVTGAYFARGGRARSVSFLGMLGSGLFSSLLLFFPVLRGWIVLHALFGAAAGLFFIADLYLMAFTFPPGMLIKVVALFLFGYYAYVYILGELPWLIPAYAVLFLTILAAMVLNRRIEPRELIQLTAIPGRPFPVKLVLTVGFIYLIMYFSSYLLPNMRTTFSTIQQTSMLRLDCLIHLAATALLFFCGRKKHLFPIVYTCFIALVSAGIVTLMPFEAGVLVWALQSLGTVLGDIFLFGMGGIIAFNYRWRLDVLAFLTSTMAAGITFGTLGGQALSALKNNAVLYIGTILMIYCAGLIIMPWLSRHIGAETAWDWRSGNGKPGGGSTRHLAMLQAFSLSLPMGKRLTPRELEIAALLLERYDYASIAGKLYISQNTLKVHIRHIYQKLDVASRKALIDRIGTAADRE